MAACGKLLPVEVPHHNRPVAARARGPGHAVGSEGNAMEAAHAEIERGPLPSGRHVQKANGPVQARRDQGPTARHECDLTDTPGMDMPFGYFLALRRRVRVAFNAADVPQLYQAVFARGSQETAVGGIDAGAH